MGVVKFVCGKSVCGKSTAVKSVCGKLTAVTFAKPAFDMLEVVKFDDDMGKDKSDITTAGKSESLEEKKLVKPVDFSVFSCFVLHTLLHDVPNWIVSRPYFDSHQD